MSSAATREARKKAILGRGGDRLAKLTTSARGQDAPAFTRDGARSTAAFVGEETHMPPPPPPKDVPRRPSHSPPGPDASVWSEEHQRQFMQALMGANVSTPSLPPASMAPPASADDPLSTMMAQLAQMQPNGQTPPGLGATAHPVPAPTTPRPRTRLQTWLPLVHLLCMWSLLAVFVLWKEPHAFVEKTSGAIEVAFWKRWPTLMNKGVLEGWGVRAVPFFWAFMTVQVMLHSLRIFSGQDQIQPPTHITLALPHLPSPWSSYVMNGLRYLRIGSSFMDDVAGLVFGIGVIVWITSWLTD